MLSFSGFRTVDGSGTVQLACTSALLATHGFVLWDLGMGMGYKEEMGAHGLPRPQFVEQMRMVGAIVGCPFLLGLSLLLSCCCLLSPPDWQLRDDARPSLSCERRPAREVLLDAMPAPVVRVHPEVRCTDLPRCQPQSVFTICRGCVLRTLTDPHPTHMRRRDKLPERPFRQRSSKSAWPSSSDGLSFRHRSGRRGAA